MALYFGLGVVDDEGSELDFSLMDSVVGLGKLVVVGVTSGNGIEVRRSSSYPTHHQRERTRQISSLSVSIAPQDGPANI
jgi:hypothetical protein